MTAEVTVPFDVALKGGKQSFSYNNKRLSVNIPAGTEDGKKIRLRGQGQQGMANGPAGDLILTIRVAPHSHFRREGRNLYTSKSINMVQAALGGKVRVMTYDKGAVDLKIPEGTQPGKRFKLKELGPEINGRRGDLYVDIHIDVPRNLSAKARAKLEEFAKAANLPH
ncbi:MAG: J domain-containing protein [candidate division KSB1 bacterium]|nr:J domain-containing protein [candidate division KSB1 bacterium]